MSLQRLWFAPFVASSLLFAAAFPAWAFPINFPPPGEITLLEYVNDGTGHFVLLADRNEIAAVDAGGFGPWRPTGYSMKAWSTSVAPPGAVDVCRFYSSSDVAHFFTPDAGECAYLRANDVRWHFEGIPFRVSVPTAGSCPGVSLRPVYRLYNNRWMLNDSTHRYTPDVVIRDRLVAQGWTNEGISFCTSSWIHLPQTAYEVRATSIRAAAECEGALGSCVALDGLLPMSNMIEQWLPPFFVTPNPRYVPAFTAVTGAGGILSTAQPIDDAQSIVAHSYVQGVGPFGGGPYGIHLSAQDASPGPLKYIEPLYQFATSAPADGAADARVFPWRDRFKHTLELTFTLKVQTIRRTDSASHVYGLPVLQFRDARSGESFYFALQTFGTVPPADTVGADMKTGKIIVSTVFRADPLYGQRVSGDFMPCDADAVSGRCAGGGGKYDFMITRGDFARIVAAARGANPLLSPDVADYLVVNFSFRVQSYLGGEAGLAVAGPTVRILWGEPGEFSQP
jgi:hypothetical protein